MKYLLDTHVLIWLNTNPAQLSAKVRSICEETSNELYVSIASFWELSIKMSLGKIDLSDNALAQLQSWCYSNHVTILPIEVSHCERVKSLPFHHRDPFDRLFIAQALELELTLISADGLFSDYEDLKLLPA